MFPLIFLLKARWLDEGTGVVPKGLGLTGVDSCALREGRKVMWNEVQSGHHL